VKRYLAVFRRESITIARDKRLLLIVVFFPLLLLIVYGYGVTFDIKHVPIAFYDQSKSTISRDLIDRYRASEYFNVVELSQSHDRIDRQLINDDIVIGIIIPPDFGNKVKSQDGGVVQVLVNGSDANTANVALGYHAAVFADFTQQHFRPPEIISFPEVQEKTRIWYNPGLKSSYFIVPGIIAIIMMLMGAILTSTAIVKEKESGSIEQIIASPVKAWEYIAGKISPYIIICLFDVVLVVAAAYFIFDVPVRGSVLQLGFFSLLFLANALGIGLFVSAVSKNVMTAQMMAVFISLLPSILLSGFVFPIGSMPAVIQAITYLVPARYFLEILRGIFLKETGFSILWPQGLFLCGNALFFLSLASIKFKKTLD
jgi:ABC-2 type transport system permease protein